MTMDSSIKMPLSQRINFRVLLFVGLILLLIGAPFYIYIDSVLSGGIKNRGDFLEVDLKAMSKPALPFGDGHSSPRIAAHCLAFLEDQALSRQSCRA